MGRTKKQKIIKKVQRKTKTAVKKEKSNNIFSIIFVASTAVIFVSSLGLLVWSKMRSVTVPVAWSEVVNAPQQQKEEEFIKFYGPNGFAFNYPQWSEIKEADLPKESFPANVKLLLMETNNESAQLIAVELSADAKKDLKTIITDDIKEESLKVSNLQILKQDISETVANMELTYGVDGFTVHMLAKDFLVKTATGNKVYSLAAQVVDSEFSKYKDLAQKILDSAQIIAPQ